jgi:hypothetical protein
MILQYGHDENHIVVVLDTLEMTEEDLINLKYSKKQLKNCY